ncbi:MAG: SpoIIE family protein phosphatase [Bacteroidales bacterium]|nr:SpoIIE family protein phosphatase [Bacteroidales bacterium]
MRIIRILLLISILTFSGKSYSQLKRIGIPFTLQFNTTDVNASSQNWCSAKDSLGVMYFGNTNGLLIYDGANWELLKTPTSAAVKSVCINHSDGKIYVGTKSDFGYLDSDESGSYIFKSLTDMVKESEDFSFTDVWNIICSPSEGVIFNAMEGLFILNGDSIHGIKAKERSSFTKIFECGNKVFVVSQTDGIQELKNGKLQEVPHLAEAGSLIRFMDEVNGRMVVAHTQKGIFEENDSSCAIIDNPINNLLGNNNLYCGKKTHNGDYIFGTMKNGIVITDSKFNYITEVNVGGRVTSVYEDDNNLIWVATDKGITLVDVYSPFSEFPNSITGIQGSIRSILQVGDNLYIGADAVFHNTLSTLGARPFKEMPSVKGRNSIWKLDTIRGLVVGGGEKGLFSIDPNTNTLTDIDYYQTRNIRTYVVPEKRPDLLLGCSTSGLSVYDSNTGDWQYSLGAVGFYDYVRHIGEDNMGYFMGSDRSRGVSRFRFNDTYDTIVDVKKYTSENGLPSDIDNFLMRTPHGLAIGTVDGFYSYNAESDQFEPNEKLNKSFGGKKTFDLMYHDGQNNYWVKHVITNKRDENIKYWYLEEYKMIDDSTSMAVTAPFRPYKNRINSFGYIGNGCYIIGDINGFIHYDERIEKDFEVAYKALIRKVENIYGDSLIYGGYSKPEKIVLPYEQRNLRITFSATSYEHPESIRYKTWLENNDEWSDFRAENFKEYPNLRPGKYTMHVVAINCYNVYSDEDTITFEILPPWYLTIWAIIIYVIAFVLIIWLIIKMYTQKLIRDKQKLEQIVEERTSEIREKSKLILAQNEEIVQKNKSITDSINYAKHIQTAMLPLDERIKAVLPDHFILFRPKDIVSGDYYWFAETEKSIIITAADCTGHGVPGAFMSMIGSQILTEIVADGITSPDEILTNQNRRIRKALKQDTTDNHDGMDMALCTIDKETHVVEYAGAHNQLIVIQNGELTEYKADKQGIGGTQIYGDDFQFKKTAIQTDGNTWFYMFSDGYKDQFGGPDNGKFMIKRLRKLLMDIHDEAPEKQREILNNTIQDWIDTGKGEQTDDIILLGFKL